MHLEAVVTGGPCGPPMSANAEEFFPHLARQEMLWAEFSIPQQNQIALLGGFKWLAPMTKLAIDRSPVI